MSTVQATMISGRYRTELLCSKWSPTNSDCCQTPSCCDLSVQEDLYHILSVCGSLTPTRERLVQFTLRFSQQYPEVQEIVNKFCNPTCPHYTQFLIDCSILPDVIEAKQHHGSAFLHSLFRITRTWCYVLHKSRLKILDRWHGHKF